MSRRLDVELTSRRDDGSWTWRAAGAKQPKGVLDGELLPPGTSEGDVLRVDADFEVDGIFVTEVLPPKARSGKPPSERIELLGPPERSERPTTTSRTGGRGARKQRSDGDRQRRRSGSRDSQERSRKRDGDRKQRKRDGDQPAAADGDRQQRRKRRDGDSRSGRDANKGRKKQGGGARAQSEQPERPPRPKVRKLRPGRKHRDALIASLPAEQQVIAEQVARGGLAAVRTEIEAQNRKAADEGAPEVPAEGLLSLAESLVGPMQIAEWRDRADAAIAGIERVDLRDLRSVLVAAEDFARDPEAREIAETVRNGLNDRLERGQREWHDELRTTLAEGRVVRALRLSSRPPKAGAPLPPEVAQELTAQANAALGTGNSQHRIAVVLEAVAFSPIRPYVVLPHIPTEPSEELLDVVRKVATRLPEVATALGIDPAAPAPRGRPRRGRGRRPQPDSPATDTDQPSGSDETDEVTATEDGQQPEPRDAVDEDAVTEDTVTEDTVTEDAVTEDAVTEDAVTEDAVAEDAVAEDAVAENTVAENAAADAVVDADTAAEESDSENPDDSSGHQDVPVEELTHPG